MVRRCMNRVGAVVLTIHQLRVLVVVAEEMSVQRAAQRLTVTQPAVSASLAALEREVGVELFARRGRSIELTPAGAVMVDHAQAVLRLLDEAIEATRREAGTQRPVRLGATTASAAHVLTPLLATVRSREPTLDFTLEIGNRATIWRLLTDHSIDVAMSTRPPTTRPFVSFATRPNRFVLVARPGLVWSGRLEDVTWLMREEGSSTRAAMEEVMARLGIKAPTIVIGSNEAIQHSAESGLGMALLPAEAVTSALRRRTLVLVRSHATPLARPWHVVGRAGESLDRSSRRFLRLLVEMGQGFDWTAEGLAAVAGTGGD